MSAITTHVLDTTKGQPARGVRVILERNTGKDQWGVLADSTTDADGRVKDLLPSGATVAAGIYRLTFHTGGYFQSLGGKSFYPYVQIFFESGGEPHLHIPLLLSPFGYTTYRGS